MDARHLLTFAFIMTIAGGVRAQPPAGTPTGAPSPKPPPPRVKAPGAGALAERAAIRFVTPETGGAARPRFITERELAFFTRVEALIEGAAVEGDAYPERSIRAATDRLVARAMLGSLYVHGGSEPPDLPRLVLEQRAELADRVGGTTVLEEQLAKEGITEPELAVFLRDQIRAAYYIDRAISPLLAVTEDQLRETFKATLHPFRGAKYDEVKLRLRRWLVVERLRALELEFLQSARTRIKIAVLLEAKP